MLDCIERLVPEVKVQDKIQKELNLYKSAAADFGRKMAVRARHTLLPGKKTFRRCLSMLFIHLSVFLTIFFVVQNLL